jgi:hypothetical protein
MLRWPFDELVGSARQAMPWPLLRTGRRNKTKQTEREVLREEGKV